MATRFAGHRLARGSTTERAQRLRGLNENQFGGQGAERIQAAIVFMSHGSWGSLVDGLGAHEQDWRDVLVNGGLADDDWPAVLAGNLVPPALDLKPCALGTTSGMRVHLDDDAHMTPDDLRRALAVANGEAVPTCISVFEDPDATIYADWDEHRAHTASLLTIYRRRARHVQDIGLPTEGFQETVMRLETTLYGTLRVAVAEGAGGYPWCVVFLAPDHAEVMAALAVLGPMSRT